MKLFHFYRTEDHSGVSGTGPVVEGVQFSNGWCVLRWISERSSLAMYQSIEDVRAIHGHGGKTEIIVHDFEALERRRAPVKEAHLEVFMQVIEEASRILDLAEDPQANPTEVETALNRVKQQIDDFAHRLMREKVGRVA